MGQQTHFQFQSLFLLLKQFIVFSFSFLQSDPLYLDSTILFLIKNLQNSCINYTAIFQCICFPLIEAVCFIFLLFFVIYLRNCSLYMLCIFHLNFEPLFFGGRTKLSYTNYFILCWYSKLWHKFVKFDELLLYMPIPVEKIRKLLQLA